LGNIRLVDRIFDVLEVFLKTRQEMRLSDIADLSGLDKSTVNRIVSALAKRGYIVQHGKRGKYSLGIKFLDFSGIIKMKCIVREIAMPHLIKLSDVTNESVLLSALSEGNGCSVAYCETIHSQQPLRIVPDEGTLFPFYGTSNGKIFLAAMSEEDMEKYLHFTEIKAYTPNTITDISKLKNNIQLVAREGVAFDDEEFILGARGVSSSIRDSQSKVVAAVCVLGPSIRLTYKHMMDIVPDVKECALMISRDLGYKGS
jgi:DNA-binding IclR family transcriptional regulator